MFYCEDTETGKQTSLKTKVESEAQALLHTRNEAVRRPAMNLQIAQVYLRHSDPTMSGRTWQNVMDEIVAAKSGPTGERWKYAVAGKAFDCIRDVKLVETTGEQFLRTLRAGTVTTNVYLRRLHNFALGMHWLPWPILPKLQWPALKFGEKRAVTFDEHRRIIEREGNELNEVIHWPIQAESKHDCLMPYNMLNCPEKLFYFGTCPSEICFTSAQISAAGHAVQRTDSFTGFGYLPAFTPAHQEDLLTGITLSTSESRTNPISGIVNCIINLPNEISDLRPMRLPLMLYLLLRTRILPAISMPLNFDTLDERRFVTRGFCPPLRIKFLNEAAHLILNCEDDFLQIPPAHEDTHYRVGDKKICPIRTIVRHVEQQVASWRMVRRSHAPNLQKMRFVLCHEGDIFLLHGRLRPARSGWCRLAKLR